MKICPTVHCHVVLLCKGGRLWLWKGKGTPPHAGMVLLPSRKNPKIRRWQYPAGFSPADARRRRRERRAVHLAKREADRKPEPMVHDRFKAYAAAHGKTVREMTARTDNSRNVDYMAWIPQQLAAWHRETGRNPHHQMKRADHDAFTAWLKGKHMGEAERPEPEAKPAEPTITSRDVFKMRGPELRALVEAGGPDGQVAQAEIERRAERRKAKGGRVRPEGQARTRAPAAKRVTTPRPTERRRIWSPTAHAESLGEALTDAQANKLATDARAKGQRLVKKAEGQMHIGLENTPRRAAMGGARRERASAEANWGQRLIKLADAIEAGDFQPTQWDQNYVKNPTEVGQVAIRARYTDRYTGEVKPIAQEARVTVHLPGEYRYNVTAKPGEAEAKEEWDAVHRQLEALVQRHGTRGRDSNAWYLRPTPEVAAQMGDLVRQLKPMAKRNRERRWYWAPSTHGLDDDPARMRRMVNAGFTHNGAVPQIMERLDRFNAGTHPEKEIKPPAKWSPPDRGRTSSDAERRRYATELEGGRWKDPAHRRIEGFFPTPYPEVAEAIERLQVEPGMSVLEPSAGTGSMADLLPEGVDITTAEVSPSLRQVLTEKGYTPAGNFRDLEGQHDRVLMNPPFERGQDMEHVREAFERHLKPGGRLVAIVSAGSMSGSRRAPQEFQSFVAEHRAERDRAIDPAAWKRRGTAVSTVMITLEKPTEPGAPMAKGQRGLFRPHSERRTKAVIIGGRLFLLIKGKRYPVGEIRQRSRGFWQKVADKPRHLWKRVAGPKGGRYIATRRKRRHTHHDVADRDGKRRQVETSYERGHFAIHRETVGSGNNKRVHHRVTHKPSGKSARAFQGSRSAKEARAYVNHMARHVGDAGADAEFGKDPDKDAIDHMGKVHFAFGDDEATEDLHRTSTRDVDERQQARGKAEQEAEQTRKQEKNAQGQIRDTVTRLEGAVSGWDTDRLEQERDKVARAMSGTRDAYDHAGFTDAQHRDLRTRQLEVLDAELEARQGGEQVQERAPEHIGGYDIEWLPDEDRFGLRTRGREQYLVKSPDKETLRAQAHQMHDRDQKTAAEIERGGPLPSTMGVNNELRSLSKVASRRAYHPYLDTLEHTVSRNGIDWRPGERDKHRLQIAQEVKKNRKRISTHGEKARRVLSQMERLERAGLWHPSKGAPDEHREQLAWLVEGKEAQGTPKDVSERILQGQEEAATTAYRDREGALTRARSALHDGDPDRAMELLEEARKVGTQIAARDLMDQDTALHRQIQEAHQERMEQGQGPRLLHNEEPPPTLPGGKQVTYPDFGPLSYEGAKDRRGPIHSDVVYHDHVRKAHPDFTANEHAEAAEAHQAQREQLSAEMEKFRYGSEPFYRTHGLVDAHRMLADGHRLAGRTKREEERKAAASPTTQTPTPPEAGPAPGGAHAAHPPEGQQVEGHTLGGKRTVLSRHSFVQRGTGRGRPWLKFLMKEDTAAGGYSVTAHKTRRAAMGRMQEVAPQVSGELAPHDQPPKGHHAVAAGSGHVFAKTADQHGEWATHRKTAKRWGVTHLPSGLGAGSDFGSREGAQMYAKHMHEITPAPWRRGTFGQPPTDMAPVQAANDAFHEQHDTRVTKMNTYEVPAAAKARVQAVAKQTGAAPGETHTVVKVGPKVFGPSGSRSRAAPTRETRMTAYRRGQYAVGDVYDRDDRHSGYDVTHIPTGKRIGRHKRIADARRATNHLHKTHGDLGSEWALGSHTHTLPPEALRQIERTHSSHVHEQRMKRARKGSRTRIVPWRHPGLAKAVTAASAAAAVPEDLEGHEEEDEAPVDRRSPLSPGLPRVRRLNVLEHGRHANSAVPSTPSTFLILRTRLLYVADDASEPGGKLFAKRRFWDEI